MIYKILFTLLFVVSSSASTLDTNTLLTLDLDEVRSIVQQHINTSQDIAVKSQQDGTEKEKEGDVVYELKKALLIVLARPNRDFMSEKVLPDVEKQLERYDAYFPTLESLVKESARLLKDEETPIKLQSAYLYVIENIIAELQPQLKKIPASKKVFKLIANSNIKISSKLSNFRRLEKMENNDFDPSGHARKKIAEAEGKSSKPWWKFW